MKTLIHNADIAGRGLGWVLIDGQRIAATGSGAIPPGVQAEDIVDAGGRLLMPGAIDCHIHMREPGMTRKGTIASETRAAILGGVTSVLDMPNNVPPTTTIEAWRDKCDIAARDAVANYGFFLGATDSNIEEIEKADRSRIPGVKLFMGSSTGNMLVSDDDAQDRIFANAGMPVCVHAEDEAIIAENRRDAIARFGDYPPVEAHGRIRSAEACLAATNRALMLGRRNYAHVHIAHVTTAAEVEAIRRARQNGVRVTAEVSPHHLIFCDADYSRLGTRIKMNPAVKTADDREALREALRDGIIDIIATDHAPHLPSEKTLPDAPCPEDVPAEYFAGDALHCASGAPMVQFAFPLMLDMFGPRLVADRYCKAPAEVYGIRDRGEIRKGAFADLVLLDTDCPRTITDADVASPCGWTPATGITLHHRVNSVWVNGRLAVKNGTLTESVGQGAPLEFYH